MALSGSYLVWRSTSGEGAPAIAFTVANDGAIACSTCPVTSRLMLHVSVWSFKGGWKWHQTNVSPKRQRSIPR